MEFAPGIPAVRAGEVEFQFHVLWLDVAPAHRAQLASPAASPGPLGPEVGQDPRAQRRKRPATQILVFVSHVTHVTPG
jgi:hypothetical protein